MLASFLLRSIDLDIGAIVMREVLRVQSLKCETKTFMLLCPSMMSCWTPTVIEALLGIIQGELTSCLMRKEHIIGRKV